MWCAVAVNLRAGLWPRQQDQVEGAVSGWDRFYGRVADTNYFLLRRSKAAAFS
jgi:hypothetical protein